MVAKKTIDQCRGLPSYGECLELFDKKKLLTDMSTWREYGGLGLSKDFLKDLCLIRNRNVLIETFINEYANFQSISTLVDRMEVSRRQFFIKCVQEGAGVYSYVEFDDNEDMISVLQRAGLLFRFETQVRNVSSVVFCMPLELCFVISSRLPECPSNRRLSALLYMSYSQKFLTYMASKNGCLAMGKSDKLARAVDLYKVLVASIDKNCVKFSSQQKNILQIMFNYGGAILGCDFNAEVMQNKNAHPYFYDDPFEKYLKSPNKYNQGELLPEHEGMVELISKGIVGLEKGAYYNTYNYCITQEAWSPISEMFFGEIDAKRLKAEKKLYVTAPADYLTCADRICDDLIKTQIAVGCGLLEVTQKSDFKKQCLKDMAKILEFETEYLQSLIMLLPLARSHQNIKCCELKDIEYDIMKILFNALKQVGFLKALIPVFIQLHKITCKDRTWLSTWELVEYILHTREFSPFQRTISEGQVGGTLQYLSSYGLLEMSEDFSCVRFSDLFMKVVGNQKHEAVPVIAIESKPLIIQPNLEILVPYNTKFEVFKSLAKFTEVAVIDKMVHFRMTKAALLKGLDQGWKLPRIKKVLSEWSLTGVPATVEKFIDSLGKQQGEALVMPCEMIIKCSSPATRAKICALKQIDTLIFEDNPNYIGLRTGKKDMYDVMQLLKKKGVLASPGWEEGVAASILDKAQYYLKKKVSVSLRVHQGGKDGNISNVIIDSVEKPYGLRYRDCNLDAAVSWSSREWIPFSAIIDIKEEEIDEL